MHFSCFLCSFWLKYFHLGSESCTALGENVFSLGFQNTTPNTVSKFLPFGILDFQMHFRAGCTGFHTCCQCPLRLLDAVLACGVDILARRWEILITKANSLRTWTRRVFFVYLECKFNALNHFPPTVHSPLHHFFFAKMVRFRAFQNGSIPSKHCFSNFMIPKPKPVFLIYFGGRGSVAFCLV